MATTVFPTRPNAAISEANWTATNAAISDSRRVVGLSISDAGGLDVDISTGVAIVDGMRVEVTSTETVTLTASSTNRVWLQKDGTVYGNTSPTPSASTDLLLGVVGTGVGSIGAIYADFDFPSPSTTNYEWFPRRINHGIGRSVGTATTQTMLSVDLNPGLYWVHAVVQAVGGAGSAGQSWTLSISTATAASRAVELGVLNHGDDDSKWIGSTGGTAVFTGKAANIIHPVHVIGMVYFADAGSIDFAATTSSHFTVNGMTFSARKIL